jgi:hypothetical protein
MDFAYHLIEPVSGLEMFAPDGFLSGIPSLFLFDGRYKPFSRIHIID